MVRNANSSADAGRRNKNAVVAAPSSALALRFSTLLGSTLETIVHHLLHSRSIYPPDSFVFHRHLGVRCYASRVPQVCEYISETLAVAVPAICRGVADALILVILEEEAVDDALRATAADDDDDDDGAVDVMAEAPGRRRASSRKMRSPCGERTGATKTLERFVFQFDLDQVVDPPKNDVRRDPKGSSSPENCLPNAQHANGDGDVDESEESRQYRQRRNEALSFDAQLAGAARSDLERSMRDCVLRVLALRGRRKRAGELPDNLSFKLCLHVADTTAEKEGVEGSDGKVNVAALPEAISPKRTVRGIERKCTELTNALGRGDWFQPESTDCLFSIPDCAKTSIGAHSKERNGSKGLLRPLKDVNLPSCGMRMQLGMEVDPSWSTSA